ncbi:MAG: gamma-glutamyltransferase [Pseudomonadota bacterium]
MTSHRKQLLVASLALVLVGPWQSLLAAQAAVAMPDQYAAAAARDVLEAGGNAVDAAIAATFVLAVTYPEAGNIGGGGFMLSYVNGEAAFLDFRERAPLAATRNMFLDDSGEFVQRRSLVGALAVGVPGTVRGMQEAHRRYARLPWRTLLVPAVRLARDGFVVPDALATMAREASEYFAEDTNFAAHFALKSGERFRQPDLALTLMRIADDPDNFYKGLIAQQIISQMAESRGLINARDLSEYTAVWREPLQMPWREYSLLSAPPPSSGGIALAQQLGMRDAAQPLFGGLAHNSAEYLHLLAEIQKRVFADRGDYLGDPDFGDVPVTALIDSNYLRQRATGINPNAISANVQPGLSMNAADSEVTQATRESPDTTHFSVIDGKGNAVSLTYTLNFEFGSGVVVEGAGFLLNNEMDDFSAKPGVPNGFGVIGADMNAIEPGKRMLSSMSPSILLQGETPAVVLGTPGGSTIFTSVFQVLLNLLDYDMSASGAVAAPRFHHQLPDYKRLRHDPDPNLSARDRQALEALGYEVVANWWGSIGDVQLVRRTRAGLLEAASDPRGRGVALVFDVAEQSDTAEGS